MKFHDISNILFFLNNHLQIYHVKDLIAYKKFFNKFEEFIHLNSIKLNIFL